MSRGHKSKDVEERQYCNKFNKHFKKWPTLQKVFKKMIQINEYNRKRLTDLEKELMLACAHWCI